MNAYAALGALAIVAGSLGGLVWYANRAGKNAASVSTSEATTNAANTQTEAMKRMAEAAGQEVTDATLIQRMKDGTA